ncbi:transporter substrate-binding domain-containing protein [bacterium]|nr:transporter substrate-binding domain-containing protein [bacterium]
MRSNAALRLVIVTLSLVTFGATIGPALEVRLVSDPWPPFTGEQGQPRIALDLVTEALRRADVSVATEIVAVGEVSPGIAAGRFDGSAAMWRDDDRRESMLFSAPYLENRLVLVGRAGSDVTASSLDALAGQRIAVVGSWSYGEDLSGTADLVLVPGRDQQQNLERLMAGQVDYMLVDELVMTHARLQHPREVEARLAVGDQAVVTRTLHLALRRDVPGADVILASFDRQIRGMIADGTYNRILGLDWIRADVDRDGVMDYVHGGSVRGERPTGSYALISPERDAEGQASFYFGGQRYRDWSEVPATTSRPADEEQDEPFTIFRFDF